MRRSKKLIALVALFILVAGVGASSISGMTSQNLPAPAFKHQQIIVDERVTLEAGNYKYYEFAIPSGTDGTAAVRGTFTSTGQEVYDSEIVVTIIPEHGLADLKIGKGFEAYYFSGRVSSGEINAKVTDKGPLYLVFDNRVSESDKVVDARIELAY